MLTTCTVAVQPNSWLLTTVNFSSELILSALQYASFLILHCYLTRCVFMCVWFLQSS